MIKYRLGVGTVALMVLVLIGAWTAPARAQEPYVMKFATQTINDLQHEYMKVFKAELEKTTNGRIRVELYPAGQLGNAPRMTEGLRLGTIEAAIGPAELFVGADPRFQVLAMAGIFKNVEHARRVLDTAEAREAVFAVAESRNLVAVGLLVYDMQSFATKTPVTHLKDLTGKRIRVLASEVEQAAVQALGAASVPMALPEVMPALQQGTIDGANSVLGAFVAFKYFDAAPHLLDTGLWALIPVTLISKPWFARLPPELQKEVRDVAPRIEPTLHQWQLARIEADKKTWLANGGKIVMLPSDEQEKAAGRVMGATQRFLIKNPSVNVLYEKLRAIGTKVK